MLRKDSIEMIPPTTENITTFDDSLVGLFTKAIAGRAEVVTDDAVLTDRGHDFWGFGATPGLLLRPRSTGEIAEIMRVATEHHGTVVPRGGASNCSAGMMPTRDRVLLDLSGLNRIIEVDVDNRRARVEPGVINSDLQERLAPHGLCFSPDPVSAHLATVAGNIIENAGGPHALKYGVT
jgi:glycolate oxidase